MINSSQHREEETSYLSACFAFSDKESESANCVAHVNILVFVNTILSITSLLGNILILIALQKESSLHPPSKLLFRCLSCTDLLVALVSQPIYIIYLTARKNQTLCLLTERLANISSAMLCGESITVLTAISIDRLLALLLRLRYRQIVTLKGVRFLVIISWTTSIVFAFSFLLHKLYFFLGSCAWIAMCLAVSSFCYLKIYVALRRQQSQVQRFQSHPGATLNIAWYKKTVSSAMWIHFTLVVCYLPYTITTVVNISNGVSPYCGATSSSITGVFVFLNSTLNPFLYCWKIREVRQAVKNTLRHWFCLSWALIQYICTSFSYSHKEYAIIQSFTHPSFSVKWTTFIRISWIQTLKLYF